MGVCVSEVTAGNKNNGQESERVTLVSSVACNASPLPR